MSPERAMLQALAYHYYGYPTWGDLYVDSGLCEIDMKRALWGLWTNLYASRRQAIDGTWYWQLSPLGLEALVNNWVA